MPANLPTSSRQLIFSLGERYFALKSELVDEVARMPRLSRVPHAPPALLGLANLRGTIVPVLSLAKLLQIPEGHATRIIIVNADEPVALAVGAVSNLTEIGDVHELDVAELIARNTPVKAERRSHGASGTLINADQSKAEFLSFMVFSVASQEFALPLQVVAEVLALPSNIAMMPMADDVVIGSAALRGAILPLLSARALLGLPVVAADSHSRVLVVNIGGHRVGLVSDALRSVIHVPEHSIDSVPHALNRGGAEARIQAIIRLENGKRLVSVLAADQLLRDDITARLLQGHAEESAMAQDNAQLTEDQFLLFRIGTTEFGMPISAVEQVAPLPPKLTSLPKAPAFVKGVMNLRGEVVPVIDQAQRFGSTAPAGSKPRVLVVRIDDLRAGFVVDEASEVTRFDASALGSAPDFGNEETQVFERVANLPLQDRIILIISPRALLSRAERDILREIGNKGAAR